MLRRRRERVMGFSGALLVLLVVGAAYGLGGVQVYPPYFAAWRPGLV